MVKRLRHRPFTAVTGVQIPLESFALEEAECADVAQLAEQLICNQQVIGSSPIIGSMDGFPSGQRGQTVNLLATPSKVRILLHPFLTLVSQREQPKRFESFSIYFAYV